jgi:hypothetical protein
VRRIASACLVGLLVTGCGLAPGGSSEPEPSGSPLTYEASPATGTPAPTATIKDPAGDLTDASGRKVTKNALVDITALSGSADRGNLNLKLALAGGIPKNLSSKKQALTYRFVLETNRSGAYDFWLTLTNTAAGKWAVTLDDYRPGGQTYTGPDFRGTLVASGSSIVASIPLAVLGSPSTVRIAAVAQRSDDAAKKLIAADHVPKRSADTPGNDWLIIGR